MKTSKEALMEARIIASRKKRKYKKSLFLVKLAKRRGLDLPIAPCQEGAIQIVKKVLPAAHGYFYTSYVCGGCEEGREYIERYLNSPNKKRFLNDTPTPKLCEQVKLQVLYTEKKIKEGSTIVAEGLYSHFIYK